jgi:prevent-host-death family protein
LVVKTAGIREARQNLTALIDEVRKGREVLITDRGKPVARLLPPQELAPRPFRGRRRFRASVSLRGEPLSATVSNDREDRF